MDYQCSSPLANIVSIYTELRGSELRTKEDRLVLGNSERILRDIHRNLPIGVEFCDEDDCLVDINNKEFEVFGLSDKDEALRINLSDSPDIPSKVKEKLGAKGDVDFSIDCDLSKVS